jgi:acyl-CoA synthetase (AMP-forming)/AMP-acid ligase II
MPSTRSGDETAPQPQFPDIHAGGRWFPADRGAALAASWLARINDRLAGEDASCAAAVPFSADGVALFAALSARRGAAVMVGSDPASWPDNAPMYRGLPLALAPESAGHAAEAERRGFVPLVLENRADSSTPGVPFLRTTGFVVQTSGSTGAPKVIFRPTSHVVAGAMARADALGLARGDGLIGGVPFSSGQGVVQVVTAISLGGPLGLLGAVDHRQALSALAQPRFRCWRATPHFADVLGRCSLRGDPIVPEICLVSSAVGESVHRTFAARFGIPLRGAYSSTETGAIAVDAAPAPEVCWRSVGRPLPGVEVRIGDSPSAPWAASRPGRVWVRSPWLFGGHGVPPQLERPRLTDGFLPTRDVAQFDVEGRLSLRGRLDDCIRTREGRLVDLGAVAAALQSLDDVSEAIVVPVTGEAGPSFGAVLHCRSTVALDDLRRAAAAILPASLLPRRIVVLPDLPRLASGKPDRMACIALAMQDAESV